VHSKTDWAWRVTSIKARDFLRVIEVGEVGEVGELDKLGEDDELDGAELLRDALSPPLALTPNRHPLRGYSARRRQERGLSTLPRLLPSPRSEGARGREGPGMGRYLVLQRHFSIESREPAFVVAAPGVGLAASAPAGPMQPECLLGGIMQYHAEQTPHLRHRHRDQAGAPPFSPSAAAARVTARKAWASRHSVICRYHPTQRRTSY
jgi:hypothetical protein